MGLGFDVRAKPFREAVVRLQTRAERQQFEERLTETFVPTQAIDELENDRNQLVFGRRGVGKTHTLKVFLGRRTVAGQLCSYIDCTSFGSGVALDGTPLNIAIRFFSGFMNALATSLLDHATRREYSDKSSEGHLLDAVAELSEAAAPTASLGTFDYQKIVQICRKYCLHYGTDRLFVVLDEWAQIPLDAQPFFAEFLKRAFFSNPQVTLKIGVVDYSYRLSQEHNGSTIGLEKAADVFADLRMDPYFVWDEHGPFVERFFGQLLFNHLSLELHDSDAPAIDAQQKVEIVLRDLFTQQQAFQELCRAAEGNARDFLVIFTRAHNEFMRQEVRQKIGIDDVTAAAAAWYKSDKLANVSTRHQLENFLKFLIDDLISKRRSRTFMVPSRAMNHPILVSLYQARLLHPLSTEWSHPDKPGERFGLVTIDYGAYVSFRNTKNKPIDFDSLFFDPAHAPKGVTDLVPVDDRRSIRRIVLSEEDLVKRSKAID